MPGEKPKIDISKVIGYEYPPQKISYNRRDVILHALGIGIGPEELKFVYELDPNFAVFPTYPLGLSLKGDSNDVNSFAERVALSASIPGFPPANSKKIVNGQQSLEILHHPLPLEGNFEMRSKIVGVYDKGKGMVLVDKHSTLIDPKTNIVYAKLENQSFMFGLGSFDGPKQEKGPRFVPPKDKNPDAIDVLKTETNQALLFRLSGDYNTLHADPTVGQSIGFNGAILHGIATMSFAVRSILKHFAENDPTRFKSVTGRFSNPVYPGETLETRIWKIKEDKSTILVVFETVLKERNKVAISNGAAVLLKKSAGVESAKL
ncbi:7954_t:CDS:2 [Ambispora leptoticha]|uniref:7954_t:CDS:1 n=1 Tax=Ambispora leptoticha TaxID=144679 RepID=A0A9N8W7D0_9GLOM|nr:7954_t:CDS:2 [Ambispora leptoticha]